jgi:hypothetical protein
MTRNFENRGSRQTGMAYFVRRSRDGCAVIGLHPDHREAIIASGLALTEAEDLCVRKIDEMRGPAPPPSDDRGPDRIIRRRNARQLAFKF